MSAGSLGESRTGIDSPRFACIPGCATLMAIDNRRHTMAGKTIKVRSTEGGEFDCYLATPAGGDKVPAVVLACAVHGVDADIRAIADEFAAAGYIAAAPDLFWRTVP